MRLVHFVAVMTTDSFEENFPVVMLEVRSIQE